jgi:hypothetical protein
MRNLLSPVINPQAASATRNKPNIFEFLITKAAQEKVAPPAGRMPNSLV